MSHKKKIYILLIISVIVFVTGYVLLRSDDFNLCNFGFGLCTEISQFGIGQTLMNAMPVIILVLSLLLFFSEKIFIVWSKFASIFILLSILLLIIAPISCSGFNPVCFTKYLLVQCLSI